MIPHYSKFFELNTPQKYSRRAILFGKGPSFKPDYQFDRSYSDNALLIAINETSRHMRADINVFIDLECFILSMAKLSDRSTVFMPYKPHFKHVPVDYIDEYLAYMKTLFNCHFFDLGRPAGYDINFLRERESNQYPTHEPLLAISNTSEAVFHMLCLAGFKHITSYGIDGGTEYHPLFQTPERPCATNPNLTQFETFAKFSAKYDVSYSKL